MKVKEFKVLTAMLFIAIFFSKMVISVAPVIFHLDNKVVKAVIMQLENESKEKDTAEKDICKEKKSFDEYYTQLVRLNLHVIELNILHNQETLIYHYAYAPVILTPPPNA
ncbi:hypothetical protein LT679_08760 [Mucilaginibacter roseus]|uniref:Uncharacterized protein n=1 Tax=Mucilaginibacter roseus TaxID=1528868 RepID=A0ABS8U549_9SPHI|nr:hypothetical protein [Mucilaginibacter roseus]MCD8740686.1 hypothetical protein [Mucilaginibacter roseus]